ncbi:MAG TPA: hypothetical protein VK829_18535, partial [Terriglobales bacterium]|nr:hypothetical protein [Terriglobales bacterium]
SPSSKAGINVVQISGNYPSNTSVSVENILRQPMTTATIFDGIKNITITDPIVGSYAWDTNSTTLNTSIVTTSASIPNRLDGGITTAFTSVLIPNSSTAPVVNELVKLTGSPTATATVATTSDTSGKVFGICLSNCSATGSSTIVVAGSALCNFDNATIAGDWVIVGATGKCHDSGLTTPTSGVTNIGRVLFSSLSSPQSVLMQITEK